MAIIATNIDSVFDVIRKLRESNFEIVNIQFNESRKYFSVRITKDNQFVKIINHHNELIVMSNFNNAIFTNKVLIFDDLSYEELK